MNEYYVYILTNKGNTTLYIGVTNNLKRRLYEHKNDLVDGFSKRYKLHKLIYWESGPNIEEAIAREKQLKRWSRKCKENLINGMNPNWVDLSESFQA